MFKYVKFTIVEKKDTVLEFRGGDDVVKVNHFDSGVVSLKGSNTNIDALISSQVAEINCTVITKTEFKTLVSESTQLKRIRDIVANDIAKKYTIADELAMGKRQATDVKRVAYELHVTNCIATGKTLKAAVGY